MITQTQSIIKNLIDTGDFVIVPRKFYERALIQERNLNDYSQKPTVKRSASFKVSAKNKAFYDQLDKDLSIALREVQEGKVIGPFDTVKESRAFFESLGLNYK